MAQNFLPITSITNIQKRGKREFSNIKYKVVLSNMEEIGLIVGKDLSRILIQKGYIQMKMAKNGLNTILQIVQKGHPLLFQSR